MGTAEAGFSFDEDFASQMRALHKFTACRYFTTLGITAYQSRTAAGILLSLDLTFVAALFKTQDSRTHSASIWRIGWTCFFSLTSWETKKQKAGKAGSDSWC